MYTPHFKLSEPPFSIAPNPRYLYLSPQHREALAHLLYGVGVGGGFVALTGEVGTGKTTLCRCLVEQLPEDVDIALIFNPRLNPRELLANICDELRVAYPGSKASLKQLIDGLNHHLLETHARGRRTVVVIDEAQNLSFDVLEQIRLLTNLETNQAKLLQIILVGQPELNQILDRRNLRQLSQRITARYHLNPLSLAETQDYIQHRLAVSGGRDALFTGSAIREIYRRSGGIPRLVNVICDRALLGAYTIGRTRVNRGIARQAARELLPEAPARRWRLATAFTVALAGAAGLAYWRAPPEWLKSSDNPPPEQKTAGSPEQSSREKPGQNTALAGAPANAARDGAGGAAPKPAEPVTPPDAGTPPTQATAAAAAKEPLPRRLASPDLTRSAAFARLLSLWKLEPPSVAEEPCAFVEPLGLRCLSVHDTWFQLQNLNHPAVLELVLPEGVKRYVTLAGIRDGKVELSLDGENAVYDLAEILPFWRGDAVLLWRPPGGMMKPLTVGDRSEAVKWIRERLPDAPAPSGQENYFDAGLKARIAAFQTEQGLTPDGMVGAYTMIHLGMRIEDAGEPRLAPVSP
jgi:general secretion pathway protein A